MSFDTTMQTALVAKHDVSAVACMDQRFGLLLGVYARTDVATEAVEIAASASASLCSRPDLLGDGEEPEAADEALCVSGGWVHAFARIPRRPELVLLGVARSGVNIPLLRTWLTEVADRVGREA